MSARGLSSSLSSLYTTSGPTSAPPLPSPPLPFFFFPSPSSCQGRAGMVSSCFFVFVFRSFRSCRSVSQNGPGHELWSEAHQKSTPLGLLKRGVGPLVPSFGCPDKIVFRVAPFRVNCWPCSCLRSVSKPFVSVQKTTILVSGQPDDCRTTRRHGTVPTPCWMSGPQRQGPHL